MKKRQRTRTITWVVIAAVVIAAVIVVAYYLSTLSSGRSKLDGKPVSPEIYASLQSIAQSSKYGPYDSKQVAVCSNLCAVKPGGGTPFASSGKPIIVFIGADYCPLCAFQRWPLAITMMRFGNLTNLLYMQSSPTDSEPNTYTFSFYGYHYTSKYITVQAYEEKDVSGNPLQTVPSNYSTLFNTYGAGYPFLEFNNKYILEGAYFVPDNYAGLNWTQIIQQIRNPNTQISTQVMESANALTALICNLTGNNPANVCNNPSITALSSSLVSYQTTPGSVVTLNAVYEASEKWGQTALFQRPRTTGS
jgi:hypothetical protein